MIKIYLCRIVFVELDDHSIRTEKTYVDWNRRFILFHGKKHPLDMGAEEVEQFLTYLTVRCNVAQVTPCKQGVGLAMVVSIENAILRSRYS